MKKLVISLLAAMTVLTACTPEQQQAVAKQLGTAAAVIWIGTDNPTAADKAAVKEVVTVIRDLCCTNCSPGGTQSYYAKVYPLVEQYINAKIKPAQQPMAKLGAGSLLMALDMAMAMNPKWAEKETTARMMIEAFCDGALVGLNMAPDDPVMQAACRNTQLRIRLKR